MNHTKNECNRRLLSRLRILFIACGGRELVISLLKCCINCVNSVFTTYFWIWRITSSPAKFWPCFGLNISKHAFQRLTFSLLSLNSNLRASKQLTQGEVGVGVVIGVWKDGYFVANALCECVQGPCFKSGH